MRKGYGRLGTLLTTIGIVIAILITTAVFGDLRRLYDLLDALQWSNIVILVLLAVVNHGLRYWRWELLLKRVAFNNFKRSTAILLFSAGSLLIFTPARVGEIAKSVYVRDFFSIPISTSLPIIIFERLTDAIIMVLLAALGLLLLGEPFNTLLGGIILSVILIIFVFRKPLLTWTAHWNMNRLVRSSTFGQVLSLANNSQRRLLSADALGINLSIGTSTWIIEVFIYFFSLLAIGVPLSFHLFVLALAVFPLASLGGSISFLPGGLGATEGGIIALGILLGGLSQEVVVLSALLSRVAILSVVVLAGIVSVLLLRGKKQLS